MASSKNFNRKFLKTKTLTANYRRRSARAKLVGPQDTRLSRNDCSKTIFFVKDIARAPILDVDFWYYELAKLKDLPSLVYNKTLPRSLFQHTMLSKHKGNSFSIYIKLSESQTNLITRADQKLDNKIKVLASKSTQTTSKVTLH